MTNRVEELSLSELANLESRRRRLCVFWRDLKEAGSLDGACSEVLEIREKVEEYLERSQAADLRQAERLTGKVVILLRMIAD